MVQAASIMVQASFHQEEWLINWDTVRNEASFLMIQETVSTFNLMLQVKKNC